MPSESDTRCERSLPRVARIRCQMRAVNLTNQAKPVPVKTGISLTTSLAQTAPGMVLKPRQPSSLVSSQALSAFKPRQQSSVVRSQASSAVIPRQQSFLVSSQASSGAKPPQRSSIVSSQASSAVKPRLGPPGRGRGGRGKGGAHTQTHIRTMVPELRKSGAPKTVEFAFPNCSLGAFWAPG